MRRLPPLMALASLLVLPAPLMADTRCSVPMAQWQPKEALEAKLTAEGWSQPRIRVDDGCYKVRAAHADGRRLKAKFDPATLEMLRKDRDDD
ncbi:MAG: PepSY domain-containing protein [Proteobacteria bacterium]|nr:PepSY domain-containing protein [Pseudomonadota bacterium]